MKYIFSLKDIFYVIGIALLIFGLTRLHENPTQYRLTLYNFSQEVASY